MTDAISETTPAQGGMHLMVVAACFFSLMALCVKLVGARIPAQQIVVFRAGIALVLSWWMLRRRGIAPWGTHRGLLFLRGLFGFLALSCFFWAVVHLPLAEATVLQYLNPVLTAILAGLVLGEGLRRREILSVGISLLGLLLVTRPALLFGGGSSDLDPVASALAVLGAALSACAYVTVRKIGTREHPLVIVFWFPLVATPLSLPAVIPVWTWPTFQEWLLLLAVGAFTQIAQVAMTTGLQREPAGRATAVSYLQVVFAAIWGALVFGELPDVWTLAGATLIIGSAFLLISARRNGRKTPFKPGGVTV